MAFGLFEIGIIVIVCLGTAGATLLAMTLWLRRGGTGGRRRTDGTAIRFLRGRMIQADPEFDGILTHRGWDGTPGSLRPYFQFRFANLPEGFPDPAPQAEARYGARHAGDPAELRVSRRADLLSIALHVPGSATPVADHVELYRKHCQWLTRWITHSSPNAVWVTDEAGEVIWSNTAYRNLVKALGLKEEGPSPSILRGHDPVRSLPDREQRRHQLTYDDGRPPCWIDVSETVENGLRLHHAVDVTAVVQAEAAQRTFVQTLTKTFAQLSTGLAIFDRTRRLALFNPALVDMTGLSAEYLSGRPGYLSFFDRLRDSDSMPEPRSYANWREKIFDLIAAAEDGRYQETWTLSSGRTYRVTGRPHPNGAIAFLLEDISAEVTLTRRFREQLDMSNAVIEALDEAVAVFSPQGKLSYTNAAYRQLWGVPEGRSALDLSVGEASHHWQDRCEASPVWGDFRDFVVGFEERADWEATVQLRDGRPVDCRFRPLNGGATLAVFRVTSGLRAVEYQGFG